MADNKELRDTEILRQVLDTHQGREFLWRLLEQCSVFHSISGPDTVLMAIASGKKDIGLWVLREIFEADPEKFYMMQKEANERRDKSSRDPSINGEPLDYAGYYRTD